MLIALKVQEYGNQSLKEHITSRMFDDRKSLGPQILNLPRLPKVDFPLRPYRSETY